MTKKSNNQAGFGAIEALLILIVVLLVGFIGYYVWNTNHKTDTASIDTTKTSQGSSKEVTKKVNYLVITEWNVRLVMPETIQDTYYSIGSDVPNVAYLSTHSLVKASAQCAPEDTPRMAIFRQSVSEHDAAIADQETNGASIDNVAAKYRVGDYYYDVSPAQSSCYEASNTTAAALDTQFRASLPVAIKTIQVVPGS